MQFYRDQQFDKITLLVEYDSESEFVDSTFLNHTLYITSYKTGLTLVNPYKLVPLISIIFR